MEICTNGLKRHWSERVSTILIHSEDKSITSGVGTLGPAVNYSELHRLCSGGGGGGAAQKLHFKGADTAAGAGFCQVVLLICNRWTGGRAGERAGVWAQIGRGGAGGGAEGRCQSQD